MKTKKELALILSKIISFEKPNAKLEQYQTPSELAANILWDIHLKEKFTNKKIIDLGCGTGIFGIGALLLGAKEVTFIDIDKTALDLAEKNLRKIEGEYEIGKNEFICSDVFTLKITGDIVLENPPFGVQTAHADKDFLESAMRIAPIIYSIHKIESKQFIEKIAKEKGYLVKNIIFYDFELPLTQSFHNKKKHAVKVGIWELRK